MVVRAHDGVGRTAGGREVARLVEARGVGRGSGHGQHRRTEGEADGFDDPLEAAVHERAADGQSQRRRGDRGRAARRGTGFPRDHIDNREGSVRIEGEVEGRVDAHAGGHDEQGTLVRVRRQRGGHIAGLRGAPGARDRAEVDTGRGRGDGEGDDDIRRRAVGRIARLGGPDLHPAGDAGEGERRAREQGRARDDREADGQPAAGRRVEGELPAVAHAVRQSGKRDRLRQFAGGGDRRRGRGRSVVFIARLGRRHRRGARHREEELPSGERGRARDRERHRQLAAGRRADRDRRRERRRSRRIEGHRLGRLRDHEGRPGAATVVRVGHIDRDEVAARIGRRGSRPQVRVNGNRGDHRRHGDRGGLRLAVVGVRQVRNRDAHFGRGDVRRSRGRREAVVHAVRASEREAGDRDPFVEAGVRVGKRAGRAAGQERHEVRTDDAHQRGGAERQGRRPGFVVDLGRRRGAAHRERLRRDVGRGRRLCDRVVRSVGATQGEAGDRDRLAGRDHLGGKTRRGRGADRGNVIAAHDAHQRGIREVRRRGQGLVVDFVGHGDCIHRQVHFGHGQGDVGCANVTGSIGGAEREGKGATDRGRTRDCAGGAIEHEPRRESRGAEADRGAGGGCRVGEG